MRTQKVVFVGSKALGASVLNMMFLTSPPSLVGVITIDDSSDVRCALKQFQEFERRTNIPLKILKKGSELKSAILEFQPDFCIVLGWYWILKPDLLNLVPNGWLGLHASLLPNYRGGAPLVWAILNGETETGLSLFYFDEGMDTGDIVAQRKISIDFEDTIADVLAKVEIKSSEIIREYYPMLLQGNAPRLKQDHNRATYAALRQPLDGKIDWSQPASKINDFIRAQTHPYPGAFCYLNEKTLRVWYTRPFNVPFYGTPGQIAMLTDDQVIVTCGNGTALRLYRVQLDGSEEQDASKVLKFGQYLR